MDRDNIFRSCSFHADAGDIIHVLIKDLAGEGFIIGLNESTGETTEDEVEVQPEGEVYLGTFGSLYNFPAVSDVRGITSAGWHIPTSAELLTLQTYLGGEAVAGGKLKEVGLDNWSDPNIGATNEVLFNARGAGVRTTLSIFGLIKEMFILWTSTIFDATTSFVGQMIHDETWFTLSTAYANQFGLSLRAIKDTTTLTHGQTGFYVGNDGTVYNTICIGTQEYTSVNLDETKYRDGSDIPVVEDYVTWSGLATGAMCYYDNTPV